MRAIDADALIELLKREEEYLDGKGARERADGITDAIMDVIDAPTIEPERKGKWIPVSKRLPDIKEHYTSEPCIVYCDNGAYGFAVLEENIFGQVGWNCERDDEYHEPLGEVLAWMPLLQPYKENEE